MEVYNEVQCESIMNSAIIMIAMFRVRLDSTALKLA